MESVATCVSSGVQLSCGTFSFCSNAQINELEGMKDQPSIRHLYTFLYDVFHMHIEDIKNNQTTILADYVMVKRNVKHQNEHLQTIPDTSLDASSIYTDILSALLEVLTVFFICVFSLLVGQPTCFLKEIPETSECKGSAPFFAVSLRAV